MARRRLLVFLALIMCISFMATVFTGCKQAASENAGVDKPSEDEEDKEGEDEGFSFPPKENVKISIMTPDFGRGRDTLVDKEFEKRLNMTFEWTLVPMSDYDQKLSLQLASGDLTDLILLKNGKYICDQYGPQGYFVDIKPYIDAGKMPNVSKWGEIFPEILTDLLDGEGRMFALENFNTDGQLPVGYLYRKDVFDDMGRELPETWDEMYDALVEFKSTHPDSTPITVRWGSGNLIGYFYRAYWTQAGVYFNSREMKYKFGPVEDEERFKKAVQLLNKFYSAGLIDPEFATLTDSQWEERIVNGKAIAFIGEYILALTGEIGENEIVKRGKEKDPDFDIEAALPPKNEYGERANLWIQYAAQPYWAKAINAKSNVDRDLLVALLDYTVTDEAIELANWGIEGVTFTRESDGSKKLLPKYKTRLNPDGEVDPIKDGLDGRSLFWVPLDAATWQIPELEEAKNQDLYHKHAEEFVDYELLVPPAFTEEEKDQIAQIMTPINTLVDESVIKFMTGELSIDTEWDEFINKLKGMGWEKVVEMYNNKLEQIPEEHKVLKKTFLR
ncbi:MAG: extracellular solute-binding protein, partial [Clostridiales bacterium]|nr:extracellular solute-binding protein [Clostridiales bacterium]